MFDDIYVASSRLRTATAEDVSAAERAVGARMPEGYGEFVTRLGEGCVNNLVRVNMPGRYPALSREWQAATATYFF